MCPAQFTDTCSRPIYEDGQPTTLSSFLICTVGGAHFMHYSPQTVNMQLTCSTEKVAKYICKQKIQELYYI